MAAEEDQDSDEIAGQGKDGKTGKSGKTGAGAMGAGKATLTNAFITYMTGIGAPMEIITQILREHSHLKGEDLQKALIVFSRDIARASAHAIVQFDGKDFSLVNNLLLYINNRDIAQAANKLTFDDQTPGFR